jgi:hypothetical protein
MPPRESPVRRISRSRSRLSRAPLLEVAPDGPGEVAEVDLLHPLAVL